MNAITRKNLDKIRKAILPVLANLGEELNVSLILGRGQYTDEANGWLKVEIATLGENGSVNTQESEDYKRLATSHDCKPEWLDQKFEFGSNVYRLIGLRRRARKKPFMVERLASSGATAPPGVFIMTAKQIRHGFNDPRRAKQGYRVATDDKGWCQCEGIGEVLFFDDGERPEGPFKHHYRCSKCDGITQIG